VSCPRCGKSGPKWTTCEECERDIRWTNRVALAFLVAVTVAVLGLMVLHAHVVYGDWTCAFAECRKIVP